MNFRFWKSSDQTPSVVNTESGDLTEAQGIALGLVPEASLEFEEPKTIDTRPGNFMFPDDVIARMHEDTKPDNLQLVNNDNADVELKISSDYQEPVILFSSQDAVSVGDDSEFPCPVHGGTRSSWMRLKQDEDIRFYCMRCWMDFLSKNLPELKQK